MSRIFIAMTLACVAYLASTAAVPAATQEQLIWQHWKTKEKAEHKLALHELRLKQTEPERWLDADIQAYLAEALWVTYYGIALYCIEHELLPPDVELLVEDGYLPKLPGNPYRDWRPMRVHCVDDGFHAGDLPDT